ncbi:MAG: ASKHA domain-containing protein, partial [Desulfovibrionales bacterium]
LDGKDVEEVLKVKAAFNLGVSKLLQEAGLSLVEVKRIVLAGALGEHISIDDLTTLGFLPVSAGNRTVTSGNTALGGAGRLLNNIRARRRTKEIAERIQVLDLAAAPDFQASYIERMRFGFVE